MSQIACANRTKHDDLGMQHHHETVADVKLCFATPSGIYSLEEMAYYEATSWIEEDADKAYERHLENAGYNEARLQEDMERTMGIEVWV